MKLVKRLLILMPFFITLNAYTQTRVTLAFKSENFERVINAIQAQTNYHFVFSELKIPSKKITINVKNKEAVKVLQQLLKGTGYTYSLFPNQLIVIKALSPDEPKTDTVKILDEVVVTALGIKKDNRKLGYSVSTISGASLSKDRVSNMALTLQGRVSGLNISGINGGPGSSARILLRGAASMSASSPLFVINGVPIDNTVRGNVIEYGGVDYGDGISNINPDDIETITVLKGSAASALYGARAANGVILINLKSGKETERLSIEYNTNLSFDKSINNTDFQYVYGQGSQNKRPDNIFNAISSGILSWGEPLDGVPYIQFDGKLRPYEAVKNNIQTFYRTAPSFTNTLSLVGGSHKNIYRISASNLDYSSVLKNGHLNRKTVNFYGAYDITDNLVLSINGNYIYENNKNKSYLSDAPLNANYGIAALATSLKQETLSPGYDAVTGTETRWNSDEYKTNPYFVMNRQVDRAGRNRYISSGSLKYRFNDRIFVQGRLGYDLSNDQLISILPTGLAFSINGQGGLNAWKQSQTSEFNSDILVTANENISRDIHFDISLGANYRKRKVEFTDVRGAQFKIPYVYTPGNLTTTINTYELARIVTQSAYYTTDISYKNYLNISVTGRYDIYSTLPSSNRGIFVPGISGSFLFSDLINFNKLDYGKLRISYAKTSGEPIVPYTTQIYYSSANQINGTPLGEFSTDLPNYNLKPFTLNEVEAGINLRFFNNRLDLDLTYFRRITNNEIINARQSVATGFTSAYVNLGKTRNTGIEINIEGTTLLNKNFKWKNSFNFTHVNNLLLSIDGSSDYTLTGTYRPLNANTALVVGKPITQIMAYDFKRDAAGNVAIGSDGIPKRGALKPMGSTLPSIYGGFSNTFSYKQFELSFLIDFRFGNKILSATENYSYVLGLNKATLAGRSTGIVAEGVYENGMQNTTNVPAYNYYPELAGNISALSVLNGSFIKFRQLTLGYTFKDTFLRKTPFRNIGIDLVARNLLTFLKYTKNIDPESQFSPVLAYAGIEGASLPAVRTFGVNLNLKLK